MFVMNIAVSAYVDRTKELCEAVEWMRRTWVRSSAKSPRADPDGRHRGRSVLSRRFLPRSMRMMLLRFQRGTHLTIGPALVQCQMK